MPGAERVEKIMTCTKRRSGGCAPICLPGFLRDQRGSQTIEFILWVPMIMALLAIVIDTTTLYVNQKEMENVARDTTRRVILGEFGSAAEAQAYAANTMSNPDLPYTVDVQYDPLVGAQTTISIGTPDISILGYGSPLMISGTSLAARVTMRSDPKIAFAGASSGGGGSTSSSSGSTSSASSSSGSTSSTSSSSSGNASSGNASSGNGSNGNGNGKK
jgi:Flp pilus assembly protein TadG